jgi:hypothetical protein
MFKFKTALIFDVQTLTEISKNTFVETFAKDNRSEDMALYVAEAFNPQKQLSEIQDIWFSVVEDKWFAGVEKSKACQALSSGGSVDLFMEWLGV